MKTFPLVTIYLLLLGGCASHGSWSKSDHGLWINLDERLGSQEQAYSVQPWGEPIAR